MRSDFQPVKYPLIGTELVMAVQTVADATKDTVTGLVFPNADTPASIERDSFDALADHIRYNNGRTLIQVVLVKPGTSFDSLDSLKDTNRRNAKTAYINARLILKVNPLRVNIPADVVEDTKEYNKLATEGNGSFNGLKDKELKRYKELNDKLESYYKQAGANGRDF